MYQNLIKIQRSTKSRNKHDDRVSLLPTQDASAASAPPDCGLVLLMLPGQKICKRFLEEPVTTFPNCKASSASLPAGWASCRLTILQVHDAMDNLSICEPSGKEAPPLTRRSHHLTLVSRRPVRNKITKDASLESRNAAEGACCEAPLSEAGPMLSACPHAKICQLT